MSLISSNSKDERTRGRYAMYACESQLMGLANSGILEDWTLYVLLAEDDLVNQKVMLLMLKKMGHKVDTASNGLEVLQSVENSSYDVILMDIQMPEMDGIAATKEIIRLWPNRCPKIIAVTSHILAGDRDMCLEAGMDDFLPKPVKLEDLMAALKKVVS